MVRSHRFRLFSGALPLAVLLAVTACDSAPKSEGSTPPKAEGGKAAESFSVGIVFDSGGRGDKSFNDSAWAGMEKAKADFGITVNPVDSKAEKDYEDNLKAVAKQGAKLVFAVGISQANAVKTVAPKFPDTKFAIIDGDADGPNVRKLIFSEEEGSFLAGYAAGLATKTNKIGFVGGMEIDLIKKFEAGYLAGAKFANPKVEMLPAKYTGSWNNVDLGKSAASVLFDSGADVVYHASGRCGLGVIAAAGEMNKYAIGVDSNQDELAKGHVLTSMIKRVDEAVYQTIKDFKDGQFSTGAKLYDLKANGVGLSDFAFTKKEFGEDNLKKLEEVKKAVIEGKLKVPAKLDEVDAFLKTAKL